jgi:hypothetical protein
MSYKNDSTLVILNKYGKAGGTAKAELYETYDQIRDLTVSGPSLGGTGLSPFASFLTNVARTFGATAFSPTLGSQAINVPGSSYYAPISGGAGVIPGGQAAFGLAPFSQYTGFPTGGAAPVGWSQAAGMGGLGMLGLLGAGGIGALAAGGRQLLSGFAGVGDPAYPDTANLGGLDSTTDWSSTLGAGQVVGGASPVEAAATGGGLGVVNSTASVAGIGAAAGVGAGRNWVLPAASVMSTVGGILTTLGPFFGPMGLAGVAAGSILNGASGAVLASFQNVSNRLLANADTVLSNKVKNLETTIKMLGAQEDILKKLLKESADGDKKALDNI